MLEKPMQNSPAVANLPKTASQAGRPAGELGLYLHWPFCLSKCPYCDFNSHVLANPDYDAYLNAYKRELAFYAAKTQGRTLASIFFGGGTPSLMPDWFVAALLEEIRSLWPQSEAIEITLEANPSSSDKAIFAAFRQAGINRLSIGVQSFDEEALRLLGRNHNPGQAIATIAAARDIFPRFSFDLIYARPGQSLQAWESELAFALSLGARHLSLYQLTIEPGTPFHLLHSRGELIIPDEELGADMYELTQKVLEKHGLCAYEISNHAAPGEESRHNLVYWRYQDYIGVGPGAHGRLWMEDGRKYATRQHRAPAIWMEKVKSDGHASAPFTPLGAAERFHEAVMMGLRLRVGIDLCQFQDSVGLSLLDTLVPKRLDAVLKSGDLVLSDTHLKASAKGLLRLNSVLAYLLGSA